VVGWLDVVVRLGVRLAAVLRRLAAVLRWLWVVVGIYFLTPLGDSEFAAVLSWRLGEGP